MINFFICPYCGQPAGKTELGYLVLIHPKHQAGTPFWTRWYRASGRRTEIGDLLVESAEAKMVGASAGLAKMQEVNKAVAVKGINPGLLRMQELNRQRAAEREAHIV